MFLCFFWPESSVPAEVHIIPEGFTDSLEPLKAAFRFRKTEDELCNIMRTAEADGVRDIAVTLFGGLQDFLA